MTYEKALFKKRQILFPKFINEMTGDIVIEDLLHLNALDDEKEIKLLFDSSGGEIVEGLAVYDVLNTLRAPVTGIVYGSAYSMAAVVLQGCRHRKATRHAKILVHSARVRVPIPIELSISNSPKEDIWQGEYEDIVVKEGIIDKTLSLYTNEIKDMIYIVSERTGKKVEEIIDLFNEDTIMYAEEALAWNLIDEITEGPVI